MDIGDRIRERRKALGLTQLELAKRLGLTSKAAYFIACDSKRVHADSWAASCPLLCA